MQISETFVDDQVKLVAQFGYPIKLTVIFALTASIWSGTKFPFQRSIWIEKSEIAFFSIVNPEGKTIVAYNLGIVMVELMFYKYKYLLCSFVGLFLQ